MSLHLAFEQKQTVDMDKIVECLSTGIEEAGSSVDPVDLSFIFNRDKYFIDIDNQYHKYGKDLPNRLGVDGVNVVIEFVKNKKSLNFPNFYPEDFLNCGIHEFCKYTHFLEQVGSYLKENLPKKPKVILVTMKENTTYSHKTI